ncbi:hypothetical protein FVA77_04725 [Phyllobacterium endophyticum]|nr:hypothetical protein FVA77_04725 [Phyllobacterium endophyticum]
MRGGKKKRSFPASRTQVPRFYKPVVEHIGHRVAVVYLGQIVELAPCEALFAKAAFHPARHSYRSRCYRCRQTCRIR